MMLSLLKPSILVTVGKQVNNTLRVLVGDKDKKKMSLYMASGYLLIVNALIQIQMYNDCLKDDVMESMNTRMIKVKYDRIYIMRFNLLGIYTFRVYRLILGLIVFSVFEVSNLSL